MKIERVETGHYPNPVGNSDSGREHRCDDRLLGGFQPHVRAYAGNIDLNFTMEQLLARATQRLEAGFKSIKMRLE